MSRRFLILGVSALTMWAHAAFAQWQPSGASDTDAISHSGNVAIGTTTAQTKLHVYTTTSTNGISVDGTTNPAISFRNTGTVAGYIGLATQNTSWFTEGLVNDLILRSESNRILLGRGSGSATMTVSGGAVGIGTALPLTPLHLYQSGAAVELLRLDNPMAGVETSSKLTFHQAGNEDAYLDSHWDATNGWALRFGTRSSGNNGADRMILTNVGKVGIGTMAPLLRGEIHGTPTTNGAAREVLGLYDTSAMAAGVGAGIAFGGKFNAAGTMAQEFASIQGIKENGTDGDYASAMTFNTRANNANPAERMRISSTGQVSIGGTVAGTQPTDLLVVNGAIRASSVIGATYQDVAEWVHGSEEMPAGTVVTVDTAVVNGVAPSTHAYDTAVAGVISAQPGVLLGAEGPSRVKVATTGRVKVRVDASHAPIHAGDLLVSSDRPGVAMRSEPVDLGGVKLHRPGTLIGKALEPLEHGEGEILVLLSLQ